MVVFLFDSDGTSWRASKRLGRLERCLYAANASEEDLQYRPVHGDEARLIHEREASPKW